MRASAPVFRSQSVRPGAAAPATLPRVTLRRRPIGPGYDRAEPAQVLLDIRRFADVRPLTLDTTSVASRWTRDPSARACLPI
jgi:hypothetical protein